MSGKIPTNVFNEGWIDLVLVGCLEIRLYSVVLLYCLGSYGDIKLVR